MMDRRWRRLLAGALFCGIVSAPTIGLAATCTDDSRECMIAAAKAYLDGLVRHDGSQVPFARDCRRTEQGNVTAVGIDALKRSLEREPPMKGYGNARYFVDMDRHEVIYFALLRLDIEKSRAMPSEPGHFSQLGPLTVHLAERFKVEHGEIKEIEAIFYRQAGTSDGSSGWPDE